MTWLVITNPRAGSGPPSTEAVSEALGRKGIDAVVHESSSIADLVDVIATARDAGIGRFAAVGGDGTAHHILNALMADPQADRPTLAMAPVGSGSDFVRTFGHSSDLDSALDRLSDPNLYTIDIGRIRGSFGASYFLNAANAGVAAASVQIAERLPRFVGSARYTTAFWAALGRFSEAPITVQIDRHRFEGKAINVVVANGQYFGGGLNIAPQATLVDGEFDVQVFSGPRRNAFTVMPRIVFGSHLTHRAVRRYVGEAIDIDVPTDWPIEADGEILGTGPIQIDVLPEAIDFVI
jgi:YegS/Rv2252/BmrU family lipid kinase